MIERLKSSTVGQLVARYSTANAGQYAAVVAFNALFALFPITLAVLTLAGLVLGNDVLFSRVAMAVGTAFPGDVAEQIIYVLQGTRQQTGLLGIISLIGLLWAGSRLFGALASAFNRIYGVPDRPFVFKVIMGTAMILMFAVLLLLSVAATAFAQLAIELAGSLPAAGAPGFAFLAALVSYAISLGAALATFLTIYYVVPNVKLGLRDVWPGALLAAVLFVLLIQVFPLYVRLVGNFGRFGAVFGFSLLVLTWLHFVAHSFLLGAALNAVRKPNPQPRRAG